MYGIWCEVSGGVTGFRQSWLKDKGVVKTFDSPDEATKLADKMQSERNGNPYRSANFSYQAKPIQ